MAEGLGLAPWESVGEGEGVEEGVTLGVAKRAMLLPQDSCSGSHAPPPAHTGASVNGVHPGPKGRPTPVPLPPPALLPPPHSRDVTSSPPALPPATGSTSLPPHCTVKAAWEGQEAADGEERGEAEARNEGGGVP